MAQRSGDWVSRVVGDGGSDFEARDLADDGDDFASRDLATQASDGDGEAPSNVRALRPATQASERESEGEGGQPLGLKRVLLAGARAKRCGFEALPEALRRRGAVAGVLLMADGSCVVLR
jgi:hypothetical protein